MKLVDLYKSEFINLLAQRMGIYTEKGRNHMLPPSAK